MSINVSELQELLLDKMAMESSKYEGLDLTYKFLDCSTFCKVVDDLCVKNLPGNFPKHLTKNSDEWQFPSSSDILKSLKDKELEVAVTPLGNADSPVGNYFAKPFITTKPLNWVLNEFSNPNRELHYYFQSQDDNLDLLTSLGCKVPRNLPLSTSVLGEQIASNLWIGTHGTTSRLHSDNFDNIYIQLSGTKRIHLIPPGFSYELNEQMLSQANYTEQMELVPEDPDSPKVLFPTYNPDVDANPGVPLYTVDLKAGDILFLPALWYHQITILKDDQDSVNISANYWYKSNDDEKRWSDWNFQRQISHLVRSNSN